jgi:cytochrome oxidase Cu insertion factor (SCO1/SenC/PrrC family)
MFRKALLALLTLQLVASAGTAAGARGADPRTIALVDQAGTPFNIADLAGRPLLVTFVATRCTDACPIANAAFDRVYALLKRDHVDARLLTLTLDPGYDTPFVMAGFAREFNADPSIWRFGSGRPADMRRLLRAFGVVTQNDKNGIPDVHSTFVYVLNRKMLRSSSMLLSTRTPQDAEDALRRL